jgi:signal peptidase I
MDWRQKYRPYILAGTLAFVMTMFIAPEMMEGPSMKPVLNNGDTTVITKEAYSAKRGEPELGQVVVLEKVYSRCVADDNVIGRVVALPGDELTVKDGQIYRKGEVIAEAPEYMENQTIKISKDDVYILNDNNDPTLDSRSPEMGPVPMKEIRGDVKLKIWPLSEFGKVK